MLFHYIRNIILTKNIPLRETCEIYLNKIEKKKTIYGIYLSNKQEISTTFFTTIQETFTFRKMSS